MASGITIPIDGSTRGLEAALRDAQGELRGFSGRISGSLRNIATGFATAFAGREIVGFLGDSIGAASDLSETMSRAGVLFGDAVGPVLEFAETADTSLGLSKEAAIDAAAQFAIFGKAAGLTGEDLSGFSTELTALATDMASFNNVPTEEVITAIGAGLRGENEPLSRFGVLLNQATLEARAMAEGIWDGEGALTQQQKSLAAAAEIMAQTSDQQGDFERTSGGLANQTKILQAQFANLQAEIGQKLLPVAVAFATWLNDEGIPALQRFGGWLEDNIPPILDWVGQKWDEHRETIQAAVELAWSTIQTVWGQIEPFVTASVEAITGVLAAFSALIRGDWSALWDAFLQILSGAWGMVQAAVMFALSTMQTSLQVAWAGIRFAAAAAWDAVVALVQAAWDGLVSAVSLGIGTVVAFMVNLPGRMLEALGDLGSLLYNAGVDVVQGLMNGITAKLGELWDMVSGIGSSIAGAFSGALGINSPSTVFIGFGENIMQGLDIGLRGGPNVVASVDGLGRSLAAPGAFAGAGAAMAPMVVQVMMPNGQVLAEAVVDESNRRGGLPLLVRAAG